LTIASKIKHPAKITKEEIVDQANAILKRKFIALIEEAFLSSTRIPTRPHPLFAENSFRALQICGRTLAKSISLSQRIDRCNTFCRLI